MLVDSNILIYAINLSSPKQKQAKNFLEKEGTSYFIAHQNILEVLRVITHPVFPHFMTISNALKTLEKIVAGMTIIEPLPITIDIAKDLMIKYQLSSNAIFDSYLVATMLSHEIYEIATDNQKDFAKFPQIKIINPFKS
ncbi:hypothetical protein A3D77_00830 [Candidatus Gottesmanbacteria bacterium RIFCSPHIGHO2_02_FULL_39_11]|uniref:PIN domain-containing protein n=1 Tax=Candidatus Gottesmanbacteria bacterium RIFCSPHIGHO2_02_FULL_39_11 TaxID=1798382 RepID=A0A1F5ZNM5_9BACT|nr:MAG: hypothetical protein A3D77_00830 [Candidatus Gottesmanbacteria bacterium RIFCSPHIGHO2_02_FULL_39_11]